MKYSDGQVVRLNDKVELWNRCNGVVVCSIDTDEYTPAYPRTQWGYLKSGVIIRTEKAGLIHYIEPDEDFRLLERADLRK
jgi:hypothetical protein